LLSTACKRCSKLHNEINKFFVQFNSVITVNGEIGLGPIIVLDHVGIRHARNVLRNARTKRFSDRGGKINAVASFSNAFTSHDGVKRRANKDRQATSKKYRRTFLGTVLVSESRSYKMPRDEESWVTRRKYLFPNIHETSRYGRRECRMQLQSSSKLLKQAER